MNRLSGLSTFVRRCFRMLTHKTTIHTTAYAIYEHTFACKYTIYFTYPLRRAHIVYAPQVVRDICVSVCVFVFSYKTSPLSLSATPRYRNSYLNKMCAHVLVQSFFAYALALTSESCV